MNLMAIGVRTAAAYFFLLLLVRLSGKRTVLQGTPFDFVVALILGDMIDDMLWAEVPASEFVVATTSLFLAHLVCSWIALNHPRVRRWLEGVETPLVAAGTFVQSGQKRERLRRRNVCALLRLHGVRDVREVASAGLELSGDLAAIPHRWAQSATKADRDQLEAKRR
jgi:uncharacterized membrane protein YcaP (DUF421 family)